MKIIIDKTNKSIVSAYEGSVNFVLDDNQVQIEIPYALSNIERYTVELHDSEWFIVSKSDSDVQAYYRSGQLTALRYDRNKLLLESDWTQGADSPLSDMKKAEWRTYRQQLRDITDSSDLSAITWPNKPE